MSEKKEIGISYGMLADNIDKQLIQQGFEFDAKKVNGFQEQLDAIHTLRLGVCQLPDSMYHRLNLKLHKAVVKHVATKNKMTVTKNPK